MVAVSQEISAPQNIASIPTVATPSRRSGSRDVEPACADTLDF